MLLEVRGEIAVICVLTVRIYGLRQKSMLLHEPQWNCAFAPFVASAVPSEDRTLPHYPAVPFVRHRKFGWRCLVWVTCRHGRAADAGPLCPPQADISGAGAQVRYGPHPD